MSKKSANAFRTISKSRKTLAFLSTFCDSGNEISKRQTDETGRRTTLLSSGRSGTHFSHSGLLRDQGYTIKGVQKLLRQHGPKGLIALGRAGDRISVAASQGRSVSEIRSVSGGFVLARSVRRGRRHKKLFGTWNKSRNCCWPYSLVACLRVGLYSAAPLRLRKDFLSRDHGRSVAQPERTILGVWGSWVQIPPLRPDAKGWLKGQPFLLWPDSIWGVSISSETTPCPREADRGGDR